MKYILRRVVQSEAFLKEKKLAAEKCHPTKSESFYFANCFYRVIGWR